MFNSKLKKENEKLKSVIHKNNRECKADNFNFSLILEQIQQLNNTTVGGKGAVLKSYKSRKEAINDVIELAKENIDKRIVELDIEQ